jgi:histidinol dehydrogenase
MGRVLMRVLPLTETTEKKFLASRRAGSHEAERVARRIVEDVQKRGDAALFAWTKRLDKLALTPSNVWVPRAELAKARKSVSREFLAAIQHAARNIRAVARRQLPQEWTMEVEPGVRAGQRVRPIESIGCYLPGGRFSLVSTLLMTVIPAQEAGVRRIVIVSPQPGAALLAAADLLGVTSVARIGGAQAIGALAYGTKSIPRVDKICGPGNRYVAAAKQIVSTDCAIDMLAGPTEAIVLASRGNARFIAADLIAQAEHDPDAVSLFVTTSPRLAREVAGEIERQLTSLPTTNLARRSLERNGAVLVARTPGAALDFVNRFAPEHLSLPEGERGSWRRFDSAGSVFLGDWSAQTFGDYASGTNHVLPTGGVGRVRGGLSAADFVKCISVQEVSRAGVRRLAPVAEEFARAEGLAAHARSVEVRK